MSLLKFVLFCAIFIVVQARNITEEEKEMFMMFTEDCRKANKPTDDDMNKIMAGNVPDTDPAKCTMTCVMKQYKIANEKDGKLVLAVDNIVKMAEANGTDKDKIAVAKEISEKCKSPEIEKECDFSAAVGKCMETEAKERGIDMDNI